MDGFDKNTKILVALSLVEELSVKKKFALLEQFDEPCELQETFARGIVEKILGDHAKDFYAKLERIDDSLNEMQKRDVHWITFLDDEYPKSLSDVYDKPIVLFAKGNVEALKMRIISVVGTRRPTRYGAKVAEEFSREFARAGLCIASGFARGVDGIAHKACIDNNCATIAVFACGLDVIYPAEHRGLADGILANDGLLISEYPLGTKPLQYHFPDRNRIVSGISEAVFLPQAAKKSGSLITIRLAIEQGKEIFVVPGNIYDEENAGCNELLREMPHALAISPEDVLDALHIQREAVKKEPVQISIVESRILDSLHDGERHFEELLADTGLNVADLTNVLFNLEIDGLIVKTAGNYYSLA